MNLALVSMITALGKCAKLHAGEWSQHKLLTVGSLLFGTGTIFLGQAPRALALEEIQLAYRGLQLGTLPVAELVNFTATGQASQNIQAVLNIIEMDEAAAIALLTNETAIDNTLLAEATETFVGESFLQLVGTTLDVPEAPGQSWVYLRNAVITAAADNRVSVIEVLQTFDANAVIVDTEKVGEVSEQVQNDFAVVKMFLEEAFL
ncbi:MAG: alpha/beta hydrolase [Cyanobacteria bacterium P01_F01_bin.86]